MENLLTYFEQIPTSARATILIGGIFIFWLLEGIIPLFSFQYKKWQHASINFFFTLCTMVIGFGLAGALYYSSVQTNEAGWGLLHLIELPIWLEALLGVMLLDFIGAYLAHWTEHRVRWMWKFHLVHHSDTHVDVTTGLRHHPGETVIRISFTILAVLLTGASMGIIMLYQSLSVLFAHLSHANIQMPVKVDRFLSYLFVTPLMHKVHHHYQLPLTDTNFGNIFSIWDRLFNTFAEVDETTKLTYGIDTHMDKEENGRLINLLKIPFQTYRPPTTKVD